MYILKPDEKTTPVMIYTQDTLIRGEVVTKQNVLRVINWLRTDGVPRFLLVLKPQVLIFGGASPKPLSFSEIHYPASQVIGFHTLPPTNEPLDYDSSEANRMMEPVQVLVGTFIVRGQVRISTQTELSTSLDVARISWMSLYEVEVTNPYLPQMPTMRVPMMLVNPDRVAFGVGA